MEERLEREQHHQGKPGPRQQLAQCRALIGHEQGVGIGDVETCGEGGGVRWSPLPRQQIHTAPGQQQRQQHKENRRRMPAGDVPNKPPSSQDAGG